MKVLVIGGGLIGLTSALQLKLNGADEVLIIERRRVGFEASFAAAGMLAPQAEADEAGELFSLTARARDYYPSYIAQLEQATDIDVGFETSGTFFASFDETELQVLENRYQWQSLAGFNVELLSATELHREEPFISPDTVGGLYFPNDWQVENRKMIGALLKYCKEVGVEIIEDSEIGNIETGERIAAVSTTGRRFEADRALICSGAWSSQLTINGDPIIECDTKPIRGQMISFRTAKQLIGRVLYSERGYLVPRKDGLILVGATTEDVGYEDKVTDEGIDLLKSIATELVPSLVNMKIEEEWSGLRPKSSSDLPIMGKLNDSENIYISTGHYRNGILLAPLSAELISNLILEDREDEMLKFLKPGKTLEKATT